MDARGATRHLEWDGVFNARDLGGLPASEGRTTRWGAVVRADSLQDLTAQGWTQLLDHGVRTVIDLRNDDERGTDRAPRPTGLTTIHLPLDAHEDRQFWDAWERGPQFGTPLYYRPHLERFPGRSAAVVAAIVEAKSGGVAFHCVGGRDRAGQIAMLVLALAGVPEGEITADYDFSGDRLRARYAARGQADQGPLLEQYLAAQGATAARVISETLSTLDVEETLRKGNLLPQHVRRLRERLLVTG